MSHSLGFLDRYLDLVDDGPAFVEACRRPLPVVVWANPLRRAYLEELNIADGIEAVLPGDGHRAGAAGDNLPAKTGAAGSRGAPTDNEWALAGRLLAARMRAGGLEVEEIGWHPGALRLPDLNKPGLTFDYYLGLYHVQEEISLVPAVVLEPRDGERVLDLCAAPGGKTAQIGCRMNNRGTVVANDLRPGRLRALRANCERLGLMNVAVTANDGTRYPLSAGPFDRMLLDVPCSCEGNVRQLRGLPWGPNDEPITGRAGLQATLLGRAWKLLRPGGTLVYATCTFAPEENEVVLDHVLNDDATIMPIEIEGLRAAPGITEFGGRALRADCTNVARLWPHLNDTGGFTLARVRKAEDR